MANTPPRADLLTGYQSIGDYLGWDRRQAEHRSTTGEIPTFKIGRTVCARMSSLDAHIAKLDEVANGQRR